MDIKLEEREPAIYSPKELPTQFQALADRVLILDFHNSLFTRDANSPNTAGVSPFYLVGGEDTKRVLIELNKMGYRICITSNSNKEGAQDEWSELEKAGIAKYVDFLAYNSNNLNPFTLLEACKQAYKPNTTGSKVYFSFLGDDSSARRAQDLDMFGYPVGVSPQKLPSENAMVLRRSLSHAGLYLNPVSASASADVTESSDKEPTEEPTEEPEELASLDGQPEPTPSSFRRAIHWLFTSHMSISTVSILVNREKFEDRRARLKAWHIGFWDKVKSDLFHIYLSDGYDVTTMQMTSADGKMSQLNSFSVPWGLLLVSFLGLPSRPNSVENFVPKFTFMQFLRNLIGGWNPVKETLKGPAVVNGQIQDESLSFFQKRWTEKKIFLGLILSFKFLVILPFKLITWPFKLLLNVVKLVTEYFLPLISFLFMKINLKLVDGLKWLAEAMVGYKTDMFGSSYHPSPARALIIFLLIPVAVLTLVVGIVQYAMTLACRIGLALTSPLKSAQYAFHAGQAFQVGKIGSTPQKVISMIMGLLGVVLSLSLSAVLWTITLPLALGALVTVIPGITTAITWVSQVPFVASSLAWLSQLPAVTASTALLSNVFGVVGTALATAFGPAVTALASLISVQVPAAVMTVGLTLGLIIPPIAAGLCFAADKVSDLWARWVEQAPIASLKAWIVSVTKLVQGKGDIELQNKAPKKSADSISHDQHGETQVYVYQPYRGEEYVVSPKPLFLTVELEKSEKAARLVVAGICITGKQAEELLDRAANVELKGLLTQGVRMPTAEESMGTADRSVKFVPMAG